MLECFRQNVDCLEQSMLTLTALGLGYYCLPYIEICSNLLYLPLSFPAKLFLNKVPGREVGTGKRSVYIFSSSVYFDF